MQMMITDSQDCCSFQLIPMDISDRWHRGYDWIDLGIGIIVFDSCWFVSFGAICRYHRFWIQVLNGDWSRAESVQLGTRQQRHSHLIPHLLRANDLEEKCQAMCPVVLLILTRLYADFVKWVLPKVTSVKIHASTVAERFRDWRTRSSSVQGGM